MLDEAIRHALATDHDQRAAELVDTLADTLWIRVELTTLRA
jgi:ATP/maltotriose-dependent transcriptional regulator MalT